MPVAASYMIPSLIGGVSSQAPQDRATSTAELQENCVNRPLKGASSRAGAKIIGPMLPVTFTDPFDGVIKRGAGETYQVLIENGSLHVINLETGQLCSVTGGVGGYLAHTGAAREAFDMETVEDTSFIVNRQVVAQMGTDRSPARPNKAMFYFKSGSYKTTYKAIIKVGGNTYTGSYTTPDNSTPENAQYIATNQLASSLRSAIVGMSPALPAGFTVSLNGSTVIVDGGSNTFDVDSEDGVGDTQLIAFKDWVKKFTDLPARCVDGYVVGVRGSASEQKNDYWLKYVGSPTTGYWEEIVQPNTKTTIDASTMPVILKCTGLNTFTLSQASWGTRLAGDGDESAKDPPFIGRRIRCLSFIAGRLVLLTAGGGMMSRARNAFVFFPDTTQTKLDTDPIPFGIENGSVPDIRSAVPIADRLLFWGDGQQLKLSSGDGNLTEETAEVLPSTNYEYDGRYPPIPLGIGSIIFGNKVGDSSIFTEVSYRSGNPIGEIPLNDHCPDYIKGSIRKVIINGQNRIMCVTTDASPSSIYVYQWLNQGDSRIQTAWNKWTFANVSAIHGGAIKNGYVYLTMTMMGKTVVERIPLGPTIGEESDVRLDHRLRFTPTLETLTPDGRYQLYLPYTVAAAERSKFAAVKERTSEDGGISGTTLPIEWIDGATLYVTVGDSIPAFFFGAVPVSRRRFSDFHVQDRNGQPVTVDNIHLQRVKINHHDTSEYTLRLIRRGDGETTEQAYNARDAIDRETPAGQLPRKTGTKDFTLDVDSSDYWVELVNDSPFPCTWVSAKFLYSSTDR